MNINRYLIAGLLTASAFAQPKKNDTPYRAIQAERLSPAEKNTPYRAIVEEGRRSRISARDRRDACANLEEDIKIVAPLISATPSALVTGTVSLEELASSPLYGMDEGSGEIEHDDLEHGHYIRIGLPSRFFPKETRWITYLDLNDDREPEFVFPPLAQNVPRKERGAAKKRAALLYTNFRFCYDQ